MAIKRGDKNDQVKNIQTKLKQLNFYVGSIDGIFGGNTDRAVKSFQASRSLLVDGIVGPQTNAALSKATAQKTTPSSPLNKPRQQNSVPPTHDDISACSHISWKRFEDFKDCLLGQNNTKEHVIYGPGRGIFDDDQWVVSYGPGKLGRKKWLEEAETNVAISFSENDKKDSFEIGGRGELQIGVLIETMRREEFELSVSRPKVLFKYENNEKLEPFEEVTIDVDEEYSSTVIDSINQRKGEMIDMRDTGQNKKRIIFKAPTRGLIGYQSKFLTETRGTGVMNRVFNSYGEFKGDIKGRRNGALISTDSGEAVAYAIFNLQDRGLMFIEPQTKVYGGMIVGEHNRDNDLEINVLKGKKLTNVRAAGSDGLTSLTPPVKMSLEEMMAYVNEDELLEVTPKNLRLRKKLLLANERKKQSREAITA